MTSLPTDYCTDEYLHAMGKKRGGDESSPPPSSHGQHGTTTTSSPSYPPSPGLSATTSVRSSSSLKRDTMAPPPPSSTTTTSSSSSASQQQQHHHHHHQHLHQRRGGTLSSSLTLSSPPPLPSPGGSAVDESYQSMQFSTQRLRGLKMSYGRTVASGKRPFVIGVCGGSASGKTTVCNRILESLSEDRRREVVIVSQDSFYKSLGREDKALADRSEYNFDHPDAFDYELFEETVRRLSEGKSAQIPVYDFVTHMRRPDSDQVIMGADVIIVEGILNFFSPALRDMYNLKIFVDTDADTRLVRRIRRDILERGRDLNSILVQYERFVKPSFDDFIMPSKKYADIIIPRGGTNIVAINLLTEHIKMRLQEMERDFPDELKSPI